MVEREPVSATMRLASWTMVNSTGLPRFIGPVTVSGVAISRTSASTKSDT